ncbi:MAG: hypothetical protein U9N60_05120 [Thermodesulfobacteriota bacterium]|nr:hypothetical protein [Thermodesulfobacteriota bacterium]
MQEILSAQANEGMVLAKNVATPEGRVLCGKGTILAATMIDRFQKMDIMRIVVEGHPVEVKGEKSLKEELQDMEERFSRVKDTPPLMYLMKRLMKKKVEYRGP